MHAHGNTGSKKLGPSQNMQLVKLCAFQAHSAYYCLYYYYYYSTIPLAGTEAETWHAISRLLRLSSLKDSNSHCNMEMQETDPSLPARCKLSKYGGQNNPLRRKLATTSLTPASHLLPENFFEF